MGRLMPTPLYNPFNFYLTLASTNIFRITKFGTPDYRDKYRFTQRIGSLSLGTRGFDFNYYNDGTPYQWMGLGDGKDRYSSLFPLWEKVARRRRMRGLYPLANYPLREPLTRPRCCASRSTLSHKGRGEERSDVYSNLTDTFPITPKSTSNTSPD